LVSFGTFTQPLAESQVSSVQTFPSSQFGADPPTQAPPLQVSPKVQGSPSSQEDVLGLFVQASLFSSQASSVQGLLSLQLADMSELQERVSSSQSSAPLQY
jgi:hypothetical protein